MVYVSQENLETLYGKAKSIIKHVVNITHNDLDASDRSYFTMQFHVALEWLPEDTVWQNIKLRLVSNDKGSSYALL